MDEYSRFFNGCMTGYVIGDALGGPLEFSERDTFNLITEMESNYLYDLPPGCWTDKTSELLCMAMSIVENGKFIYEDFLRKYHQFIVDGYMSPNDKEYEVSNYMKVSGLKIGQFLKYKKTLPLAINPNDIHQLDSEPLFRIAPIVLKYHDQPQLCCQYIEISTNLTHVSHICVDACKFYASLMIGALMGVSKNTLLSDTFNVMDVTTYGSLRYNKFSQQYINNCTDTIMIVENQQIRCKSTKENKFIRSLFPPVNQIQKGSYKLKKRDQIISNNNIINCIEAALWAFYSTNTFEEGCIYAVNLGMYSSTIGAIYGQLAGIYYGLNNIPVKWLSKLHKSDYINELNKKLKNT